MKKRWKLLGRILLIGVPVGILLFYSSLEVLLRSEWLRAQAETQVGAKLGVPVRVKHLRAGLWGPIRVEGVQVAGFLGQPDFFEIGRIEIRYRYLDLFRGRLGGVVLVGPRLYLERDAGGRWNIPPSLLEESEKPFVIPQLSVEQGVATVRLPGATYQIERVSLALTPLSKTDDRHRLNLSFQGYLSGVPASLNARGQLWQRGKQLGSDLVVSASDIEAVKVGRLLRAQLPPELVLTRGTAGMTAQVKYDPPAARIRWAGRVEGVEIRSGTRSVALEGLQMQGRAAARLGGTLEVEELALAAAPVGRLQANARYDLAGGKLDRLNLNLDGWDLSALRVALRDWLPPSLDLQGVLGLGAEVQGTSKDSVAWRAGGRIENVSFAWADIGLAVRVPPSGETATTDSPGLQALEFNAVGDAGLASRRLSLQEVAFDWGDALSGTGRAFLAAATPAASASGSLQLALGSLSPFLDAFRQRLGGAVREATGKGQLSASFQLAQGVPAATWDMTLNEGGLSGDFGEASGLALSVQGALKEREQVQGALSLSLDKMSGERFDVEAVACDLGLQSSSFEAWSGDLSLSAAKAGVRIATEGSLSVQQLKGKAALLGDLEEGRWLLDRCLLTGEGLPEVRFRAEAAVNNPRSATVEMETGTMDWGQLYAAWESELPEKYRSWLVEGTGSLALAVSARQGTNRLWVEHTLRADLGNVSFFSGDGLLAAGGLGTTLSLRSAAELAGATSDAAASTEEASFLDRVQSFDWSGQLVFEGQEMLYGTLYQDLSGLRTRIESRGRWLPGQDRLERLKADIDLQPIGGLSVAGSVEGLKTTPSVDLQLHADRLDLGQVHNRFAQEGGLRQFLPALGRWETEGILDATVESRGSLTDWQAEGLVRISEGVIGSRAEPIVIVSGFALDMPFQVGSRKRGPGGGMAPPQALIRYDQMVLGPLTLGAQSIPFIFYGNDFQVPRPVSIPFYEGQLEIRELALEDFLAAAKRLRFDIQLKDVQLAPIARDAQLPPLSGTISASLPRFDTVEGDLLADGPARLEIFKGTVDVTGLRVDDLFGSEQTAHLSAEFREIDLHELTTVLQYGRASGIIEGYVREFVASPGQVKHFVGEMKSVPRRGVTQRISVDLIEALTEAGTGLGAAERAVLRQSDQYGYRQLGLKASLDQGRFFLEGTAEKGGKKYFMVGSMFGGIDIQLVAPPKGLGFKQYVDYFKRRLKQMKKTGGPKVNVQ